jgi:serine/threonine protein kinase
LTISAILFDGRADKLLLSDLHPNNVLVQKEYFKNSSDIGYHYNLSDLGEGKSIESSVNDIVKISNVQKFGISEYQAPEISAEGYGPATDMYAFGQLAVDIIRLNYGSFIENDQETLRIPEKLADILESCLDDDPGERLEAKLIAFMLDEVEDGIKDGTADWVDSEEFLSHSSISSKLLSLASTLWSNRTDEPSKLVD